LAARAGRLERENRRLLRQLDALSAGVDIVGRSPVSRRLAGVLRRVAESDATVLIEGKAGSGKTMAAELIHKGSRRSRSPLVNVSSDIVTAEGLEKHLKDAERGTLLLEDIEMMSPPTQSRLVRHLKERSGQGESADVRVIATTSARLPELVARSK